MLTRQPLLLILTVASGLLSVKISAAPALGRSNEKDDQFVTRALGRAQALELSGTHLESAVSWIPQAEPNPVQINHGPLEPLVIPAYDPLAAPDTPGRVQNGPASPLPEHDVARHDAYQEAPWQTHNVPAAYRINVPYSEPFPSPYLPPAHLETYQSPAWQTHNAPAPIIQAYPAPYYQGPNAHASVYATNYQGHNAPLYQTYHVPAPVANPYYAPGNGHTHLPQTTEQLLSRFDPAERQTRLNMHRFVENHRQGLHNEAGAAEARPAREERADIMTTEEYRQYALEQMRLNGQLPGVNQAQANPVHDVIDMEHPGYDESDSGDHLTRRGLTEPGKRIPLGHGEVLETERLHPEQTVAVLPLEHWTPEMLRDHIINNQPAGAIDIVPVPFPVPLPPHLVEANRAQVTQAHVNQGVHLPIQDWTPEMLRNHIIKPHEVIDVEYPTYDSEVRGMVGTYFGLLLSLLYFSSFQDASAMPTMGQRSQNGNEITKRGVRPSCLRSYTPPLPETNNAAPRRVFTWARARINNLALEHQEPLHPVQVNQNDPYMAELLNALPDINLNQDHNLVDAGHNDEIEEVVHEPVHAANVLQFYHEPEEQPAVNQEEEVPDIWAHPQVANWAQEAHLGIRFAQDVLQLAHDHLEGHIQGLINAQEHVQEEEGEANDDEDREVIDVNYPACSSDE